MWRRRRRQVRGVFLRLQERGTASFPGVEGAGGKCQTWKLPLNDCRLFGVLSAAVEGKRTSVSGVDEAPRRERRIDRARWRNGEKWNPVSA